MAMPSDDSFVPVDEDGGRAPNVDSYRITCIDFIKDISHDYLAWVDRYELPEDEDKKRRTEIASIIKMAEATAGKPFQIGVFVNKKSGYTVASPGIIDVNIKATGRDGRKAKLGFHNKEERFRFETTGKAFFDEATITGDESDLLDINLKLNAEKCVQRDVISFTVVVSEIQDGSESDRRGVSTVIHIV
jgi:hypothetical protein